MELVLLLILLLLSAAFSGSETAYFSLSAADLARLGSQDGPTGKRVVALLERAHRLLSSLLIGNLLINTVASVVATSLCLSWFGPRGLVVAVPVTTLALLLFGEISPKMLALRRRRELALFGSRPLAVWVALTGPVVGVIWAVMRRLLRMLPFEPTGGRPLTTDELQTACDMSVREGVLSETAGRFLAHVLLLEDLEVHRIMTPRPDVVTFGREWSLQQALAVAGQAGFNRYPVISGGSEKPVGWVHLKDAMGWTQRTHPLATNLRQLLYVPESKDVATLLTEMRTGGTHLAAVIDEHGDFTGIVTLADCLQALLGPAADVADGSSPALKVGPRHWVVSGGLDLREINELTGVILPPSHNYVTIAGFLMARLGHIPGPGEQLTYKGTRLVVLATQDHRIERIQIAVAPSTEEEPS